MSALSYPLFDAIGGKIRTGNIQIYQDDFPTVFLPFFYLRNVSAPGKSGLERECFPQCHPLRQ